MMKNIARKSPLKTFAIVGALLLLCAGLLLGAAIAAGAGAVMSDDYGMFAAVVLGQHEECEEGYVWQPSVTNPIAGECVPE